MKESTIVNLCGTYPTGYEFIEIGSDPNFVFQNDPGYSPVTLWNEAGNKIFVNSFRECEHYVLGGWDRDPIVDAESNLQLIFLGLIIITHICYLFYSRFKGNTVT